MATTDAIGTTIAQYLIPEVWAQRGLQALRDYIHTTRLVTRVSNFGLGTRGDIIHIPVPGTFTVQTKASETDGARLQPTGDTEVQVTLNQYKYQKFSIEDLVSATSPYNVADMYIANAVKALAEDVETYVLALATSLTNSVAVGAGLDWTLFLDVQEDMNQNAAPMAGRWAILDPTRYKNLLSDPDFSGFTQQGRPEVAASGALGTVAGYDIYVSNLLAATEGGVAGVAETFVLGFGALPDTPTPGADRATVSDPESNISIQATVSYDNLAMGPQVTLAVLYGASILRNLTGVKMTV